MSAGRATNQPEETVLLVNESTFGPAAALSDYRERASRLPFLKVELPEPADSLTMYLSPVERATVRVEVLPYAQLPVENSILAEIAVRLSGFDQRGSLDRMSGHGLAEWLRYLYWPSWRSRKAHRGWILLAALDAADLGAEVYIDGEPKPGSRYWRKMRLSARLAEIEDARYTQEEHAERSQGVLK